MFLTNSSISQAFAAFLGANAVAVPPPAENTLAARDCATIPNIANPLVLNTVYNISRARNVSDRVLLATFETGWIESHMNNLPCGDQDSVGVFQQRPSQGWGTVAQCTNVTYSTNAFLDNAIANDRKFPTYTAGQLSQSVQYSEFPDRYDEAEAIAKAMIAQAQGQLGLPISTPGLSATSSAVPIQSPSGTATVTITVPVTTTTSAQSTPTKAAVLAPGTLDKTCGAFYTVGKGNTCQVLQRLYGATLTQLRFWNPSINSKCTNLDIGYVYCVSSQVVVPPSNPASGINKNQCTGYSPTVKKGQTCNTVAKAAGIARTRLVQLNKSLNTQCTNIVVGKSYCVTSIGA